MMNRGFTAIGALKLKNQSTKPALKLKPARTGSSAQIAKEIPVNNAWIKYKPGAKNMNANSRGSVTPVKKEHTAAASNKPYATFFLPGFAV